MPADPHSRPIALEPDILDFLEQGVSIHAGSRDASHVASLSRGLGCRLSADRTRLTVFLLASHSGAMLADFRANGQVAVVITLPSTHRTIQLKGTDAGAEPLQEGDHLLVARSREAFVKELVKLGWEASLPESLLGGAPGDVVAVGFTITAAFVQTPGPTAGTPLAR
jgi:hypothetical protein